tara:strand:+ start:1616 stop:2074 length:459 start_codon:yes stop_codon:yes gene_type:complete
MKLKYLITICTFYLFLNLNAQDKIIINPNAAEITFEKELIDMGTYNQFDDESSRCEFIFTNTGKEPLIIEKAKGSCGCTVPEWPKEPIPPGESAVMKVNYDEKRVGPYTKMITITSNAKTSPKIVKVKGKIIPDESNNSPILKPSGGAPIVK